MPNERHKRYHGYQRRRGFKNNEGDRSQGHVSKNEVLKWLKLEALKSVEAFRQQR